MLEGNESNTFGEDDALIMQIPLVEGHLIFTINQKDLNAKNFTNVNMQETAT